MKKATAFFVTIVFITVSHSQVQYGIKGGLNLATVRYINTDNSKARLGWNIGLMAEVAVQKNVFLRPEFSYSSKGFGYSATAASSEGTLRLNYINIPLLAGYRPSRNTSLMAGPEVGFLQKAVSKSQGITNDMTNFYRHFDVGFDLGFAYNFSPVVAVEARYNYGFKGLVNVIITDNSGNVIGQGKTGANSVLQFGLVYSLSQ